MSRPIDPSARAVVDEVARQLIAVEHRDEGSFIGTPLAYPSGASVVVRVVKEMRGFTVSDFGLGYDEAESMGAAPQYVRYASTLAERSGLRLDGHTLSVADCTRDQLVGAIIAVANASHEATSIAAFRMSERRFADDAESIYHRLVSVFPRERVSRNVEVHGSSNTPWHVAALVKGERRSTIFEPVTSHHSSIFAATTKFHDIAKAENAPARVAVVRKKAELKTYLAVLSQAANVVEQDVSRATLVRLAA